MTEHDKSIAIIGLGYVGLPLAVEFGKVRSVFGFDINSARIAELSSGVDRTLEVTTDDLLASTNLRFTDKLNDLKCCDIFIVTVPTPIDSVNRPDLSPLIKACELVGQVIKTGSIVIFESTVYPGCTEEVCVPILETKSSLEYNKEFFCGYSPERINPGDKTNTLTKIVKITSGSTPSAALVVDEIYKEIIKAGTFRASSIKVAEAAKVIENTQRDLNIALVNELSVIFERLNIDTLEVLEAAGSKWNFLPFRPGMVGGHCIGVDPYYLTHKAEEVGYHPQVILAGRRINDNMARYAARNVIRLMLRNGIDVSRARVGVLGVTFKENCPDIRNSKVFDLIKELKNWGVSVVADDCWADPIDVLKEYGIELKEINVTSELDALIVAVGHNQYRSIDVKNIKNYFRSNKPVLADLKSLYPKEAAEQAGFSLFRF